jgi:hypothetical protein
VSDSSKNDPGQQDQDHREQARRLISKHIEIRQKLAKRAQEVHEAGDRPEAEQTVPYLEQ